MFTPTSEIRLLSNIPIDSSYSDSLSWGSETAQSSYFLSKTVHTLTDFLFQRKEKSIKVNFAYDSMVNINYIMFKNGSKWYYCFVNDVNYINDQTTELKIDLDIVQTFYFDYNLSDCYIEREHTTSDNLFEHLVDENLETGDAISNTSYDFEDLKELGYVVEVSKDLSNNDVTGYESTGVYRKVGWYVQNDIAFTNIVVEHYIHGGGQSDNLLDVFTIPINLVDGFDNTYPHNEFMSDIDTKYITKNFTFTYTAIDGYTPKNKKLFNYPYNYFFVTNNQNDAKVYKYEYFDDSSSINFRTTCNMAANPTVILFPLDYKKVDENFIEAITLANYPQCAIIKDLYSDWVTANQMSNAISIGSSLIQLGTSAATKNPTLALSGLQGLVSKFGEFSDKQNLPNVAKGVSNGSLNIAIDKQTFTFYKMTITQDFARLIDNYFTKFGYRVNRLGVPNFRSRPYFNFIKCQDVTMKANIGAIFKTKFIDILKKGITFWRGEQIAANPNNFGDYDLNNAP